MAAVALEIERERNFSLADKQKLKTLIAQGCLETYAELFGQSFVNALDSAETSDKHHSQAILWHWHARLGLIQFEIELREHQEDYNKGRIHFEAFTRIKERLQETHYPAFWAYLAIWARGNLKTTLARYMAVMDAFLSFALGVGGYALIVGGTKSKVRGTAKSIQTLLQSEKIKEYAQPLSVVKTNDAGIAQGWTADFINTAGNYIFHFIGLDEGVAGANVDNIRPTFIIPDDVDDREDSPVIADSRFKVLTGAVIGTKQWNTLFFFAQNLISRFSVLYRIHKQQARVFANRLATDPIPAVRNPVYEQRTMPNGLIKDIIVSGECTWRGWNLREVQNQIDAMTLPVFNIECQHDVELSREGLMHKRYDDNVHPVSYSQFASVFGSREAWKYWAKVPTSDWARTKTKFHANVAAFLAVSSQNTPLPGHTFLVPFAFAADTTPADVAVRLLKSLTPYAFQNRSNLYGQLESKTWEELVDDAWKRTNGEQYFRSESERVEFLKSSYTDLIRPHAEAVLLQYNVKAGVNSHSEDKVRAMFNDGFGFNFAPANPRETDALDDIDEAMKVDYKLPHSFDPNKNGWTRWHVLVEDDLTAEPIYVNGVTVYPPAPYPDVTAPDDLFDGDLFRYQMRNRRFAPPRLSKTGEKIDVAEKLNDDFGQSVQFVYMKKLLDNIELSHSEMVEAQMSAQNTAENVSKFYGQEGFAALMMGRIQEQRQIELRIEDERRAEDEKIRQVFGSGRRIKLLGARRR